MEASRAICRSEAEVWCADTICLAGQATLQCNARSQTSLLGPPEMPRLLNVHLKWSYSSSADQTHGIRNQCVHSASSSFRQAAHHEKSESWATSHAEASTSHACATAAQACDAIYCIAIAHLIQEPGNVEAAVAAVRAYAAGHAPPDVAGWLDDALSDRPLGPVTQAGNAGWVRHAFVHAFRCKLLRRVHINGPCLFTGGSSHSAGCAKPGLKLPSSTAWTDGRRDTLHPLL